MRARTIRLSAAWPAVPVLYEDDALMAIDKPAGLLTARDRWDPKRDNLMDLLHAGIEAGREWARETGIRELANVHRLDAETSGVLLLAKSRAALTALAEQFERRHPQQLYLALLDGAPTADAFDIDLPIGPHPVRPGLSVVDQQAGKKALTRVRVGERFARYTLVEAEIRTGRHHQIRVHLQHDGFPLVGDRPYGGRPLLLSRLKRGYKMKTEGEKPLIGRAALHAWRLTVRHPAEERDLVLEAPLPKDLAVGLKYLRRFGQPVSGAEAATAFSNPGATPSV